MVEEKRDNAGNVPTERRLFPRLAASVDIEYNLLKKEAPEEQKTVTKDISGGGICLIVYEKIDLGSILALRINLSDINRLISAKGKVVWSSHFTVGTEKTERYDLGIEFTEIDESDRQKISQYVFKLAL